MKRDLSFVYSRDFEEVEVKKKVNYNKAWAKECLAEKYEHRTHYLVEILEGLRKMKLG